MAGAGGTFRIFVSSTFDDLRAERNALQRFVFPRLRELCAREGASFQEIDLRWGVSEEASLDQRTMPICLGEIGRCLETTPRPNFVALLGYRYGWRPLPYEIPADAFDKITGQADADTKVLLGEWYERDDNAVPPVYCLRPRTGKYEDFATWEAEVERSLRDLLAPASATAQEIEYGTRVAEPRDHVFAFFRRIAIDGVHLAEALPADGRADREDVPFVVELRDGGPGVT